jgi:hypothetical protein
VALGLGIAVLRDRFASKSNVIERQFEEMCEKSGVAMYRIDQHGRYSYLRSTRTNAHPPCRYFRQLSIRPARRRTT